jgi:hypothetical protein
LKFIQASQQSLWTFSFHQSVCLNRIIIIIINVRLGSINSIEIRTTIQNQIRNTYVPVHS